jgi:hypothetical protein
VSPAQEGQPRGRGSHGFPALPATDPTSARLLLIGTVHGDPRGYERAMKLLRWHRPHLVTVEVSRFSLRYRQRREPHWQRLLQKALRELEPGAAGHLAIRRLLAQVALPFEVRAARDYSGQFAVPWRPVDLGALSRRHLPRYGELLSPENLKNLLATEDEALEDFVDREYRRAHLFCRRPLWRPVAAEAETGRREQLQNRRLRQCLAGFGRLAHLGGWEHLVPWQDSRSLWHELADLQPLRLFLDEGDKCHFDK